MRIYGLILTLALILRIWGLGLNPVGITHDEVHDQIAAKSIALTGQTPPNNIIGIFTRQSRSLYDDVFGELVTILIIPWNRIFHFNLLVSKLPFVLTSVLMVYFMGKIMENITGKRKVGIIVALMLAINPWAVHFGRSAYEDLFSYLFYLIGLYCFTKNKVGSKDLIWGLIFLVLGFLSYFGAKVQFPFILILGVGYATLISNKKLIKKGVMVVGLGALITFGYLIILKYSPAGIRLGELNSSVSNTEIANQVNDQRRISLDIPYLRDIVINKATVLSKYYLNRYLAVFSPAYLFVNGEQGFDTYVISNQSPMYLIDLLFIILGIAALIKISLKKSLWFGLMLLTIPISILPSKMGPTYYVLRLGIFFPFLIGLVGLGIVFLTEQFNKNNRWIIFGISILYVFSLSYFWIMYWYKTPFERAGGWYFPERALMRYIELAEVNDKRPIVVVTQTEQQSLIYLYAFYNGKYENESDIIKINSALTKWNTSFNQLTFTDVCPNIWEKNILYILDGGICGIETHFNGLSRIAAPKDSGPRYLFINEDVCSKYDLNKYPYPRKIEQFQVEKMSEEEFCKNWVTHPDAI